MRTLLSVLFTAAAAYQVFAIIACFVFRRKRPSPAKNNLPVSILKPVRGLDPAFYQAIQSHTLLHGEYELLCGARADGMLIRLGKGNDGWALALRDVSPMISRGRRMDGWVRAGPAAYGDDAIRLRLIEASLDFVRRLPPKT